MLSIWCLKQNEDQYIIQTRAMYLTLILSLKHIFTRKNDCTT